MMKTVKSYIDDNDNFSVKFYIQFAFIFGLSSSFYIETVLHTQKN